MKRIALLTCMGLLLNGLVLAGEKSADSMASGHMVAQALLTAHFIDAALKAGMSKEDINAVLAKIANETVISEFWISDEAGRIVFTNVPGTEFVFPTNPETDTQAAPFAALLSGDETVVVQGILPRELDAEPFKYVGVAGVDQARIVQVGLSGAEVE